LKSPAAFEISIGLSDFSAGGGVGVSEQAVKPTTAAQKKTIRNSVDLNILRGVAEDNVIPDFFLITVRKIQ